ncbi:mitochondrial tetratricopeptide repeat (TPR) domain-containing protein [Andalucia godoyi]|uniref:Mitochondrial tetratricopeptide repeat (TPR) domain-containing protein n=1 Tax=Andalucia godoyi TaxID=505711 RepID=A0A8K0AJJ6_ANDGO|nr:mitochondrial tetratricopeptide repeat (TPR) domain-containing protein [Andalucia godoyi]|eukprot:ANDGO_02613.mRNA.1 mitochondrial tetratricopeptide repeat (TPR) domain-containing protein
MQSHFRASSHSSVSVQNIRARASLLPLISQSSATNPLPFASHPPHPPQSSSASQSASSSSSSSHSLASISPSISTATFPSLSSAAATSSISAVHTNSDIDPGASSLLSIRSVHSIQTNSGAAAASSTTVTTQANLLPKPVSPTPFDMQSVHDALARNAGNLGNSENSSIGFSSTTAATNNNGQWSRLIPRGAGMQRRGAIAPVPVPVPVPVSSVPSSSTPSYAPGPSVSASLSHSAINSNSASSVSTNSNSSLETGFFDIDANRDTSLDTVRRGPSTLRHSEHAGGLIRNHIGGQRSRSSLSSLLRRSSGSPASPCTITPAGRFVSSGQSIQTVIHRLVSEASAAAARGDLDDALACYDEAICISPRTASLYCHRSSVYFQKGDFQQSLEDALEAVQLQPSLAKAYFRLGRACYAFGRERDAIRGLEVACKLESKNQDYAQLLSSMKSTCIAPATPVAKNPFGILKLPIRVDPIEYRFVVNVHADGCIVTVDDALFGISVSQDGHSLSVARDVVHVEVWEKIISNEDGCANVSAVSVDPAIMKTRPIMEQKIGRASFLRVDVTFAPGDMEGTLVLYWLRESGKFVGWNVEWQHYDGMSWMHSDEHLAEALVNEPKSRLQSLNLPFACEDVPQDCVARMQKLVNIRGSRLCLEKHSCREVVLRHGFGITSRVLNELAEVSAPLMSFDHRQWIHATSSNPMEDFYTNTDRAFSLDHLHRSLHSVAGISCTDDQTVCTGVGYILPGNDDGPGQFVSCDGASARINIAQVLMQPLHAAVVSPISLPEHGNSPVRRRTAGARKRLESDPSSTVQHKAHSDQLLLVAAHFGERGVFCGTWGGPNGVFYGASCGLG